MTETEIPDAPYLTVYHVGIVDNKKVKLYYLGKEGVEKLSNCASKTDLQSAKERIFELSNFLNVLTDDNKFVSERLAKLIFERLPKDKSIQRWDIMKLHPALGVNMKATFAALNLLVNEGKVTLKRSWVRLVQKED
jgi:hypothetical protein